MLFIEVLVFILIGLVLGSFSTALVHRIPKKIPWGAERSVCPNCKTTLGWMDLFPILSWCFSASKCRHCTNKISCKYPLTEFVSVLLCLAIYYSFGFSIEAFFIMACVPILISLFLIDFEYMILPNQLVFILFVLGGSRLLYIYYAGVEADILFTQYIMGAVIYAGVSWFIGFVLTKVLKRNSLGFGDVKFFLVSGLWLGISILPYFMIMSGTVAIIFALAWRFFKNEDKFPFGPSLIISFYSLLVFQGFFTY